MKRNPEKNTTMEFATQICTTSEQSERLLDLGIKKETADMCSSCCVNENKDVFAFVPDVWPEEAQPRWSLHRLIEMLPKRFENCYIFLICGNETTLDASGRSGERYYFHFENGNIYDSIIDCIKELIKKGHFNKEYLKG